MLFICRALTVTPDEDAENGELNCFDYLMHFVSLPWKLFCAIIPPVRYGGGGIAFVWSIVWLGLMSLIVEQVNGVHSYKSVNRKLSVAANHEFKYRRLLSDSLNFVNVRLKLSMNQPAEGDCGPVSCYSL